jgi:predicted membrane protein
MELTQRKTSKPKFLINKEHSGILIFIAVFLLFPYLVRQVDYSAAAIDPGILSAVILSIASVLIFQAVTWWIIRVIWQVFHIYSTHHFENNFKSLESWQKVIIYLGFYLLVLYSFVGTLAAFL